VRPRTKNRFLKDIAAIVAAVGKERDVLLE
jgi:hypothetical protein